MALIHSPIIDRTNLVLHYDAANPRTFPSNQENLLRYSNDFSNGVWAGYCGPKTNITYNTNEVAAPDGTFTATKIVRNSIFTCNGSVGEQSRGLLWDKDGAGGIIVNSTDTFTASLYVRTTAAKSGISTITFGIHDGGTTNFTMTDAWQRIVYTGNNSRTDAQQNRAFQFQCTTENTPYYIWGAQLEKGPVANTYVPTIATSTSRTTTVPDFGRTRSNTGTLTNGTGYSSSLVNTAANQGCFAFDGTRTSILTSSIPSTFWNAGSWTASVWAYFNAVDRGTDNAIIGHGTAALNNGLHLGERNRRIYFGFFSNDTSTDPILNAGTWYNIVWSYNATTRERKMYLNSQFIFGNISNAAYAGVSANTSIGSYVWSANTVTNGLLNNIMLYDKVLTDAEIQNNYNILRRRYGI